MILKLKRWRKEQNDKLYQWWDFKRRNIKVWPGAYVYPTAKIGDNVSIGRNTEIGNNVVIGNNVRIGNGCFIPEGVIIQDHCFIGPHVCFTNDRYPPSPRSEWQSTLVHKGARIGAGVKIICGVVIGKNALIGAGSVVTKNINQNNTVFGVPAKLKEVS